MYVYAKCHGLDSSHHVKTLSPTGNQRGIDFTSDCKTSEQMLCHVYRSLIFINAESSPPCLLIMFDWSHVGAIRCLQNEL